MKGIAEATGRSLQQIKNDMVEQGDLGTIFNLYPFVQK